MNSQAVYRSSRCVPALMQGLAILLLLGGSSSNQEPRGQGQARGKTRIQKVLEPEHAAGEFLVRFKPGTTDAQRGAVRGFFGGELKKRIQLRRGDPDARAYLYKAKGKIDEAAALKKITADPSVLSVSPNYRVFKDQTTPDDTYFNELWGLDNTGQSGGNVDADIDAPEAWDLTTGDSNVVIAILDTGIDYTHPDLVDNLWINPGESGPDGMGGDKETNGLDDDGNGYADDVYGYDFAGPGDSPEAADEDSDPFDVEGHGTHVAGTIGGKGNNTLGVAGVNWNVKLMALRFLAPQGGWTSDAVQAYAYP